MVNYIGQFLLMMLEVITFLDKDGAPYEMNKDTLNSNFVTLSRFIKLTRDKKINEILK